MRSQLFSLFIDKDNGDGGPDHRLTTMMITHNLNHAIACGSRLPVMDAGEVVIDVSGAEKAKLSVQKLLEMFFNVRRQAFESDEVPLLGS